MYYKILRIGSVDMNKYIKLKESTKINKPDTDFSKNLFYSVYSLTGEEKIVYGKVLEGEEGEIDQISIMSEEMLDMDNKYFDNKTTDYHPYFCEFSIDSSKKLDKTTKKILKSSIGKWLKMRIIGEQFSDGDAYSLQGELIFSASPIIRVGCYLTFDFSNYEESFSEISFYKMMKKNNLWNIVDGYSENETKVIKERFKSITNEIVGLQGFVYNVGQGNCISIDFQNDEGIKSIFCDIGESMAPKDVAEEQFYIEKNSKKISKVDPSIILLSHWDLDHILGVHLLSEKVFIDIDKQKETTYWIAPNLKMLSKEKISVSSARLCAYLVKNKVILMFGNGVSESLDETKKLVSVLESKDKKIKIYQGTGRDTANGIRNNIGLILSIEVDTNNNKSQKMTQRLLFTGDCEYAQMHSEIFREKYDFLVTAHHGSKYAVLNESSDMNCCVDAQGHARAIISTGVNRYHHPEAEHINALIANGFEINFTIGYQWIEFDISDKRALEIKHYPNKKQREKINSEQLNKLEIKNF